MADSMSYSRAATEDSGEEEESTETHHVSPASAIGLCVCMGILGALALAWYASFKPADKCADIPADSPEKAMCETLQYLRGGTADLSGELKTKVQPEFEQFLQRFDRDYVRNVNITEYRKRLLIFRDTLETVAKRNELESQSNPHRAVHGITKYADWTPEEFRALLGGRPAAGNQNLTGGRRLFDFKDAKQASGSAPCSKTWTFTESAGSIRNQGQCGDCWAYSVTESIRASYIQQVGQDPGPLSTQFLVDCMRHTSCQGGVNGCCGGNTEQAMQWIQHQGGLPTSQDYGDYYSSAASASARRLNGPVSQSGLGLSYSGNHPTTPFPCKTGIKKTAVLTGSTPIEKSETAMAQHVCNTGVMSISVDAKTWQTYTGGVISAASCGTQTDHAVVAIGLDQTRNAWIVQNSWGDDWGVGLDGTAPPKNKYSNCAQLAKDGCNKKLQGGGTVADACQLSCGGQGTPKGGYVFLQFGQNTCNIESGPVVVDGVRSAR
eukprot:TRINITY_DN29574_c0_g1_i1.p1 TRINITY_DN29574_c0_g1~~TRINITY_DN29574_c0_g1_i1.p1  ORF type:complete len:492 (-),score=81.36 TRINITY_DN29574_c0_g1_i1:246-1721(-)